MSLQQHVHSDTDELAGVKVGENVTLHTSNQKLSLSNVAIYQSVLHYITHVIPFLQRQRMVT